MKKTCRSLVRKVYQLESSPITRCKGRSTKIIDENSKKDLDFDGLTIYIFII